MGVLEETPILTFKLSQLFGDHPTSAIASIIVAVLCLILYKLAYGTDIPRIDGIPEMPSAIPFLGHLHLHAGVSGQNDAGLWKFWSQKLQSDLIQVKFGNRRVVIANTFDSIKEIFVTNGSLTSSRPRQYTFEKYIGYDLGSHSLDSHFKSQRTAAIKAAHPRNWTLFYPYLKREGDRLIANLAEQGEYGQKPINPLKYLQSVAMAVAWSITFDKEFAANDPWLREYIDNACLITKVRGASNTTGDFVPIMRLHPKFRAMAAEGQIASEKRTQMVQEVIEGLKEKLANGEDPNCIAASVMADKNSRLSMWDAIKCSTSMLQGGTESIPSHLTAGMGGLLSEDGTRMQEKAFAAIVEQYPNGDAPEHAFTEEKVPYIAALYKEILRNYVVLPFSLPHEANEDVRLNSGVVIPKGTTLYMNSEAGNHDQAIFGPTADEFDPERWLKDPSLDEIGTVPYCSYGIGSRICPAWQISNRILYGLLLRMVLAFKLEVDPTDLPPTSYKTFGNTPDLVLNSPKPFKVKFTPRNTETLRKEVAAIREREAEKF